jgi:hypothetical protein
MPVIEGVIRYYEEDEFVDKVEWLYQQKHINREGFFIDKDGNSISADENPDVDRDTLCISIPYGEYQNLSIKDLVVPRYGGVMTEIDNMNAKVSHDGNEDEYNLIEWAKEHLVIEDNHPNFNEIVIEIFLDDHRECDELTKGFKNG